MIRWVSFDGWLSHKQHINQLGHDLATREVYSPRDPVESMLGIAARAIHCAAVQRARARTRVSERLVAGARAEHAVPDVLEVDICVPEARVVVLAHLREPVEDRLLEGLAGRGGVPASVRVRDEEGLGVGRGRREGRDLVENDLCGLGEVVTVV